MNELTILTRFLAWLKYMVGSRTRNPGLVSWSLTPGSGRVKRVSGSFSQAIDKLEFVYLWFSAQRFAILGSKPEVIPCEYSGCGINLLTEFNNVFLLSCRLDGAKHGIGK